MRIKNVREKNMDVWEITYLIIYAVIFTHDFLDTTMFDVPWPPKFRLMSYFVLMIYVLAKLRWRNSCSHKELVLAAVILAAFTVPAFLTDYYFLFEIGFLIVGAKDIKLDKILKVYVVIGSVLLLASMCASGAGLIENLVYDSARGGIRNSFGVIYPTDYAAHVFYLLAAWLCIGNRITTVPEVMLVFFLGLFVYKECDARTSFLCIFLLGFFLLAVKFGMAGKKAGLRWTKPLKWMPVLCAGAFFLFTYLYGTGIPGMEKWNTVLSGRLQYSAQGIREYGVSFFGQNIYEQGNGTSLVPREDYFFLDDSYLKIAIAYGIVMLGVTLYMMIAMGKKAYDNQRYVLLAVLAVVSVHCFMEQHLVEMAYNPFLLGMFADWTFVRRKESPFLVEMDGHKI